MVSSALRSTPSSLNCTPKMVPVDEAFAATVTALPETVDGFAGDDRDTITGDVAIPIPVSSAAVKTSNVLAPSVQARPICPVAALRDPVMKFRTCVPLFVPGTGAHGVHTP